MSIITIIITTTNHTLLLLLLLSIHIIGRGHRAPGDQQHGGLHHGPEVLAVLLPLHQRREGHYTSLSLSIYIYIYYI